MHMLATDLDWRAFECRYVRAMELELAFFEAWSPASAPKSEL